MITMKKLFVRLGCFASVAFAASAAMAGCALSDEEEVVTVDPASSVVEEHAVVPPAERCQIGSGSSAKTCEKLAGGWYCDGFKMSECTGRWIVSSGTCYFKNKPAGCE
jgi:hypothetical protein